MTKNVDRPLNNARFEEEKRGVESENFVLFQDKEGKSNANLTKIIQLQMKPSGKTKKKNSINVYRRTVSIFFA